MSETGVATVVWSDDTGVWTSDKPLRAPWSKPLKFAPEPNFVTVTFVEERRGTAAVLVQNFGVLPSQGEVFELPRRYRQNTDVPRAPSLEAPARGRAGGLALV